MGAVMDAVRRGSMNDVDAVRSALRSRIAEHDARYEPANLRPGTLLLLESGHENGSAASETLLAMATKLDGRARKVLLAECANTPLGFFSAAPEPEGRLLWVQKFDELRISAELVNALAIDEGSAFRVRADVYPLRWEHQDPRVRLRMAVFITDELLGLRAACLSGFSEGSPYRTRRVAMNLIETLVVGEQEAALRKALASMEDQRRQAAERRKMLRRADRRSMKVIVNLDPIDTAIRQFFRDWAPPAPPTERDA